MILAANWSKAVESGVFWSHCFPGFHLAYQCFMPLDISGLVSLFTTQGCFKALDHVVERAVKDFGVLSKV